MGPNAFAETLYADNLRDTRGRDSGDDSYIPRVDLRPNRCIAGTAPWQNDYYRDRASWWDRIEESGAPERRLGIEGNTEQILEKVAWDHAALSTRVIRVSYWFPHRDGYWLVIPLHWKP
jgi:hypothetical protein